MNNLPKTLDETYERILLSIDHEDRDIVLEALRWLCFSTKVLTIAELAEAAVFSAVVEPPPESAPLKVSFDNDNLFSDPLDILRLLSGLVICQPSPDSITVPQDDNGTELIPASRPEYYKASFRVLLSHFSIKEYLLSGRLGSQVEYFAMDEVCSHQILATNCLYFILFTQELLRFSEEYPGSYRKYRRSFLSYAAINWVKHARKAEYGSRLVDLIVLVLTARHQLKAGFLKFLPIAVYEGRVEDLSPPYVAAYGGLYFPSKLLIEKGADIDVQGGWYGSAIQAAIVFQETKDDGESFGESIVKLLLDHGANANTQGGSYDTTLQAASWFGDESIVKLLLDHGANFNIQGCHYGTALQAASWTGCESIVKLLLDNGVSVNIQGGYFDTALQAASVRGYENIVNLLLDHRANVNSRGGYHKSPLRGAVRLEHEGIFRQLLDRGAEVETEAGYYDEHLIANLYLTKSEMAVALLEHGAVVLDFRGGLKAKEALERKDFRRFVDIQKEHLLEERMEIQKG